MDISSIPNRPSYIRFAVPVSLDVSWLLISTNAAAVNGGGRVHLDFMIFITLMLHLKKDGADRIPLFQLSGNEKWWR